MIALQIWNYKLHKVFDWNNKMIKSIARTLRYGIALPLELSMANFCLFFQPFVFSVAIPLHRGRAARINTLRNVVRDVTTGYWLHTISILNGTNDDHFLSVFSSPSQIDLKEKRSNDVPLIYFHAEAPLLIHCRHTYSKPKAMFNGALVVLLTHTHIGDRSYQARWGMEPTIGTYLLKIRHFNKWCLFFISGS